jgi:demethylmenaquinone methyltransferase / 2-methoxy-6-polyprenyl-1,4-benzoquinol methylase
MKTDAPPGEKAAYIQLMFKRIASGYDLMNRLMTAGQDVTWRREVIERAKLQPRAHLLDLGAGTGDLAREALRQQPTCIVLAADFTLGMMLAGQTRPPPYPDWVGADALRLPFQNAHFDAVVSGFLLRNVTDLDLTLREQYRFLKPGGRLVALDTTRPPARSVLTPFIRLHMRFVIPLLGAIITGQRDAYQYLPISSENFFTAEAVAANLEAVGFEQIGFQRRMFGTIAIHWAYKS